jgi:hypothetical protein
VPTAFDAIGERHHTCAVGELRLEVGVVEPEVAGHAGAADDDADEPEAA